LEASCGYSARLKKEWNDDGYYGIGVVEGVKALDASVLRYPGLEPHS